MSEKKIELMTFNDYLSIINSGNKHHDNDAYKTNLYSLNKYDWVNEFSNLVEEFEMHGITFQLKESIVDKIISMTKEEKEKIFESEGRYEKQHAIIEKKTNKIVSMTSDEWG